MKKLPALLLLAACLVSAAHAAFFSPCCYNTTLSGWQPIKLGAGGYVTHLYIAPDNTMVVATDSYGAYLYNASEANPGNAGGTGRWDQLVTTNSIAGLPLNDGFSGCYSAAFCGYGVVEIQVAPNNTNVAYMYFNTNVYFTTNLKSGNPTWTLTNFSTVVADPAGGCKICGPFIGIDPNNPNIVYVGTPSSGVFKSIGGTTGGSWSAVSAVGSATSSNFNLIEYDPTSSVVGNVTQHFWISTYGIGLYETTNGGTSFNLLSGPTTHLHLFCDAGGNVYLVDNNGGNLWYESGGTLHQASISGIQSVAVDPNTLTNIIAMTAGGAYYGSTTGVTGTWNGGPGMAVNRAATDIPWLANWDGNATVYMSAGNVQFDGNHNLIFTEGTGAWKNTNPYANLSGGSPSGMFASISAGIEQLVAYNFTSPWGSSTFPIFGVEDRGVFQGSNLTQFPAHYGPTDAQDILYIGYQTDWAAGTPTTVATIADANGSVGGAAEQSGISTSAGSPISFANFAAYPQILGGGKAVAVSSPNDMLWMQGGLGGSGNLYYTTNGGAAWSVVALTGVPTSAQATTNASTSTSSTTLHFASVPSELQAGLTAGYVYQAIDLTTNGALVVSGSNVLAASATSTTVTIAHTPSLTVQSGDVISFPTVTGWGWCCGLAAPFINARSVAADRVNVGTYYAYNNGNGISSAEGVWVSINAGLTWTQYAHGVLTPIIDNGYAVQMEAVPTQAGNVCYTTGVQAGVSHPTNQIMYCSADVGQTWADVSNGSYTVRDVWQFSYGAIKPGQSWPAVYCICWVNSVGGIWRSVDHFATWQNLSGIHPLNSWDFVRVIAADGNVYGRVFVGFGGSGGATAQFNYLLNRDLDPASNDNSPAFLAHVA